MRKIFVSSFIFVIFLSFLHTSFGITKIILYPEKLKATFETSMPPEVFLYNNLSMQDINKLLKENNIPCTVLNLKINKTTRLITIEIRCSTFKIIGDTVVFKFDFYPSYDSKLFRNKTILLEIISASPYYGISKIKYHKCKKEIYEGVEYWSCDVLSKSFNLSRNVTFTLNFKNGAVSYEIREVILKKIPVNKTLKVVSGSKLPNIKSQKPIWKDILKVVVIIIIVVIIYFVIIRPRRKRI